MVRQIASRGLFLYGHSNPTCLSIPLCDRTWAVKYENSRLRKMWCMKCMEFREALLKAVTFAAMWSRKDLNNSEFESVCAGVCSCWGLLGMVMFELYRWQRALRTGADGSYMCYSINFHMYVGIYRLASLSICFLHDERHNQVLHNLYQESCVAEPDEILATDLQWTNKAKVHLSIQVHDLWSLFSWHRPHYDI